MKHKPRPFLSFVALAVTAILPAGLTLVVTPARSARRYAATGLVAAPSRP